MIQWIDTDYGCNVVVARVKKYEVRITQLYRANQDGPLHLVSLFDNSGALDHRSWSFHAKSMDAAKEKATSLVTSFLKEQIARQNQLLNAFQLSADGGAVRCSACGAVCSEYTSVTGDNIDLVLCRRCAEHLRTGLDGLGPDKTPWRYGPSFVHIFQKGGRTQCEP